MTGHDAAKGLPRHRNASRRIAVPVRWALSPLDFRAHVLTDGDQPLGVLMALCGAVLPMVVPEHEDPPGGRCPSCDEGRRAEVDSWGTVPQ